MTTFHCGAARVHLLSDGTSYWDGGGAFGLVPRIKWAKILPPDDLNRVPQELRCVLVEADGMRVLIDCGVGDKPNELVATQYDVRRPAGTLMADLARRGFAPRDIDAVVFTHLHGDHSGWATTIPPLTSHGDDGVIPTFPNARYFVQRQEYEDATHPNERTRNTYFADNFVPLLRHGVLTLLDGEARIAPSIRVVPTPGHTAGHQSVIIEPGDSQTHERADARSPIFVLGDLATYMIQLERLPWVTAYDVLPMTTIETKRIWQPWAAQHAAIVISPHDTITPAGRLVRDARGFYSVAAVAADTGQ
jgi:glyoxylase-like metal-dependent hydrolase (beta-lactamase superfamily II)